MRQDVGHHPIIRIAVAVLCISLAVGTMLWFKVSARARQELAHGASALQRGQYHQAITSYARAIKWYTPLNTSTRRAIERLWALGNDAEQQGNVSLALEAYRALRSGLYAVQSVYIPYQHWIPKSEAKIATLMATAAHAETPDAADLMSDTARFTQMLQRNTAPHVGWSMLVAIGFLGWVGAVISFIWCVYTRHSMWAWRPGLLWGGCIAVFFAAWVVGMLLA